MHRGPHPEDEGVFAARDAMAAAAADLCWLFNHGYAPTSSLKLVGDRYELTARQRIAVARSACSDDDLANRRAHEVVAAPAEGVLALDGYNVLTTIEAALAGGVILACRDSTYRDMASMHGSYRKVAETRPALERIGRACVERGFGECFWYLDRPVSNSGRLKTIMLDIAAAAGWNWHVELVADPDRVLSECDAVVATADSVILSRCRAWYNLARRIVDRDVPEARILRLF
jgi:hypothetical protein